MFILTKHQKPMLQVDQGIESNTFNNKYLKRRRQASGVSEIVAVGNCSRQLFAMLIQIGRCLVCSIFAFILIFDNQTEPNITCNVTSLAGALYILGLSRPCSNCAEECDDRKTIADYLYCLGESIYDPFNRKLVSHWIGIADLFGSITSTTLTIENNTSLLEQNIKRKLEEGSGVLLSAFVGNYGHIVRLLDVTNEGIIVDDPEGELLDGARREINGGNYYRNTINSNENAGSEYLWLWSDIKGEHHSRQPSETFWIKYVVTFCN